MQSLKEEGKTEILLNHKYEGHYKSEKEEDV